MIAKQKIYGPYRVKNIGVKGDVYQVVKMVDNVTNAWEELCPNETYLNPQTAYGKCASLNKRWQEEHCGWEYNWPEMLAYWRNATN